MKINKELFWIGGVCLIAEPFYIHLHNFVMFIISKLLSVNSVFTYFGFGVLCTTKSAPDMSALIYILSIIIDSIFVVIGFIISKRGKNTDSLLLILTGAILFYSSLHQTVYFLATSIRFNTIASLFFNSDYVTRSLGFWGNNYNYSMISFCSNLFLSIVYALMAYQIIFKIWDREFRIKIFTVGLLSCLAGTLLWYYVLGKALYNTFGLYFYS